MWIAEIATSAASMCAVAAPSAWHIWMDRPAVLSIDAAGLTRDTWNVVLEHLIVVHEAAGGQDDTAAGTDRDVDAECLHAGVVLGLHTEVMCGLNQRLHQHVSAGLLALGRRCLPG
ncbi:hypothetical protein RHA1_ro08994 (plasmid) [Rhodococcus jostii RHA1]|uniref:Uncharacterized protein n=1 Tax=Rhodococcus jostii (strain RHA1) TaxID=101510 RepID=Q0RXE8_RHOJR|nr:hypothetical protein RHA1_ro08994 [Rhodococcus jostii RHA1]